MSLRIERSYDFSQTTSSQAKRLLQDNSLFDQNTSSVDRKRTASERYKAMHDPQKRLVYHKEKTTTSTILWIFKLPPHTEPAYYEYTANGKETIYQIKQRFGIKDGALQKFNPSYRDSETTDACFPSAGTKLRFYEYDVE